MTKSRSSGNLPRQPLERHFERFWKRYEAGEWEPHTRGLIREHLQPGDLFVDIGAWIGPVSLWALERGARVIAVEPDPIAVRELRCQVPPSVEIWEGAIGVTSGIACLSGAGSDGQAFGLSMSHLGDAGGIPVRTWTLREVLAGRTPTLVKIDIEGYEIELLPQIAPFLAAAGVPIQVALHGALPERDWFAGYREVQIPSNSRGTLVAR